MNSNDVDRVVATKSFIRAIKTLKNKHKSKELRQVYDVVQELMKFAITTQNDNHGLNNAKGHKDLHISGGKLILLYRYDDIVSEDTGEDDVVLIIGIELRLQDVVNHDQLHNYRKFDSKAYKYDPEDILSSKIIHIGKTLSHSKFMRWYNSLDEELQWDVDDLADVFGFPLYDECTESELYDLKREYLSSNHRGTWRGLI